MEEEMQGVKAKVDRNKKLLQDQNIYHAFVQHCLSAQPDYRVGTVLHFFFKVGR